MDHLVGLLGVLEHTLCDVHHHVKSIFQVNNELRLHFKYTLDQTHHVTVVRLPVDGRQVQQVCRVEDATLGDD